MMLSHIYLYLKTICSVSIYTLKRRFSHLVWGFLGGADLEATDRLRRWPIHVACEAFLHHGSHLKTLKK